MESIQWDIPEGRGLECDNAQAADGCGNERKDDFSGHVEQRWSYVITYGLRHS